MTADEQNPAPNHEAAMEEEELIEKSSAPTMLGLRAAAKDLFKIIEAEPDSTSPNDELPQKPD